MFNITVNPSIGDNEDTPLTDAMLKLAKKRRLLNKPTDDVQAAFKEGVRSPVAGASL